MRYITDMKGISVNPFLTFSVTIKSMTIKAQPAAREIQM